MQKTLHIFCWFIFPFTICSQNLENKFYDKQLLGLYYIGTNASVKSHYSKTKTNFSYKFGNIDIRHSQSDVGGLYYYFNYPLFNDFIPLLFRKDIDSLNRFAYFTGGWLGWHNLGGNFIGKDNFILAGGLNFSDFVIVAIDDSSGHKIRSQNEGYHFSFGPFVNADYMLLKWLAARCGFNYNFSVGNYHNGEWQKMKKPHLLVLAPEIFTSFGIFLKYEFTFLNSRKDEMKVFKRNFCAGWRFWF